MAILKYKKKTIEIQDNEKIKEVCEKLGVSFGCKYGICGVCVIQVKKGQENLSELTPEEKKLGMNFEYRLACQCRIKQGIVEIDF